MPALSFCCTPPRAPLHPPCKLSHVFLQCRIAVGETVILLTRPVYAY